MDDYSYWSQAETGRMTWMQFIAALVRGLWECLFVGGMAGEIITGEKA